MRPCTNCLLRVVLPAGGAGDPGRASACLRRKKGWQKIVPAVETEELLQCSWRDSRGVGSWLNAFARKVAESGSVRGVTRPTGGLFARFFS